MLPMRLSESDRRTLQQMEKLAFSSLLSKVCTLALDGSSDNATVQTPQNPHPYFAPWEGMKRARHPSPRNDPRQSPTFPPAEESLFRNAPLLPDMSLSQESRDGLPSRTRYRRVLPYMSPIGNQVIVMPLYHDPPETLHDPPTLAPQERHQPVYISPQGVKMAPHMPLFGSPDGRRDLPPNGRLLKMRRLDPSMSAFA